MLRKLSLPSIAILLLPLAFTMVSPNVKAVDPCKLYIDPPAVSNLALVPTSTFNITVKLDNIPTDPGLAGLEFNITWDPSILNGVAMQELMFHEVTPPDQWDNIWQLKKIVANNSVYYAFTFQDIPAAISGGYAPISGSHTVANITLRVMGTGEYALHFYKSNLGDTIGRSIAHDTVDGFFSNLPPARARLVVRGESNIIWYRFYSTASKVWSDWIALPEGATGDSPAATLIGNTLQVVVRGVNNDEIWHGYVNLTDNSFSGWTQLSGATPSAPTLTANSTTLCLVVRGETNTIFYRFYDIASQTWSDWTPVPTGTTIDSPTATLQDNTLHIVVRGEYNDQIWYSNVNITDDAFSGWTQLSGATPSAPTLTANSTTLCLVVRGETDRIFYRYCDLASKIWSDWTELPYPGGTIDSPAATILSNTLQIVVRGVNNNQIWHIYVNLTDGTLSEWTNLSGATPSAPTLTS